MTAKAVSQYNPGVKASKKTGLIETGTVVLVPTSAVLAAALPVPDPSIEHYGPGGKTYVVRRGDNLSLIARRAGTTPAAIMRLNGLKKPLIFPGQELLMRAMVTPSRSAAKSSTKKTAQSKH